jgi:hypothetical protein
MPTVFKYLGVDDLDLSFLILNHLIHLFPDRSLVFMEKMKKGFDQVLEYFSNIQYLKSWQ